MGSSAISVVSAHENIHAQEHNYVKEVLILKMEVKKKQKEVLDLKEELRLYIKGDMKVEEEFGRSINQIIEEYRSFSAQKKLQHFKITRIVEKKGEEKSEIMKTRELGKKDNRKDNNCLLYTSPSPRDLSTSRMPSSA